MSLPSALARRQALENLTDQRPLRNSNTLQYYKQEISTAPYPECICHSLYCLKSDLTRRSFTGLLCNFPNEPVDYANEMCSSRTLRVPHHGVDAAKPTFVHEAFVLPQPIEPIPPHLLHHINGNISLGVGRVRIEAQRSHILDISTAGDFYETVFRGNCVKCWFFEGSRRYHPGTLILRVIRNSRGFSGKRIRQSIW